MTRKTNIMSNSNKILLTFPLLTRLYFLAILLAALWPPCFKSMSHPIDHTVETNTFNNSNIDNSSLFITCRGKNIY